MKKLQFSNFESYMLLISALSLLFGIPNLMGRPNTLGLMGLIFGAVFFFIYVFAKCTPEDEDPDEWTFPSPDLKIIPDMHRWHQHEYPLVDILNFIKEELEILKKQDPEHEWYWRIKGKILDYIYTSHQFETGKSNQDLSDEFKAYLRENEPFLIRDIPMIQTTDSSAVEEVRAKIISKISGFYTRNDLE